MDIAHNLRVIANLERFLQKRSENLGRDLTHTAAWDIIFSLYKNRGGLTAAAISINVTETITVTKRWLKILEIKKIVEQNSSQEIYQLTKNGVTTADDIFSAFYPDTKPLFSIKMQSIA